MSGALFHRYPPHDHAFSGGPCPSTGKPVEPRRLQRAKLARYRVVCPDCNALLYLTKKRERIEL